MSQDQPQQPKPNQNSTVKRSPTTANQSGGLGQVWLKVQPALKSQSIKVLRGTIQTLEGVVEKLEAEPPPPNLPSANPSETTITIVEEVTVTETTSVTVESASSSQIVPASPKPSLVEKLRPYWETLQSWWGVALQKIRSLLPQSINRKLPDWGLTGAIATLAILLIWTSTNLTSSKSEPEPIPPVAELPPPTIPAPPELTSPSSPEPVEIAPPPAPTLTPEENLIASIQNQVAEITSQYAAGLIQSIQANFQDSLLLVKVGQDWYTLKESEQDKLATQMRERAKELDFSKLEITDLNGTLIARNPVVGNNMIIVKRRIESIKTEV